MRRILAAVLFIVASARALALDRSYKTWDELLKKHVKYVQNGNASRVDYAGFARDRAQLKAALDDYQRVTRAEFDAWSKPQQQAFLINAYNAFTIELILTKYPDLKSIRDLGGFLSKPWSKKFFTLFGQESYLDFIEHEVLRKEGVYDDPRVHVAVVCASIGRTGEQGAEVVVVEGGSGDETRGRAAARCDRVVEPPRGRGAKMNAGARAARGEFLVFLHADTRLPADGERAIRAALACGEWGRFDVAIEGADRLLTLVATMMNLRSRLTGIATGDQAIFVRRAAFDAVGGFPEIALMEDVELCKRLRRRSWPVCLRERVTTSARRWRRHGTLRTSFLMWRLRLADALGADPRRLARRYDAERSSS